MVEPNVRCPSCWGVVYFVMHPCPGGHHHTAGLCDNCETAFPMPETAHELVSMN